MPLAKSEQAPRQSLHATHALASPINHRAENNRHTRHARAQSQGSARTLRLLRWRRSCLRSSLIRALYRRAVAGCFGGCHAFMPEETQKPRQPPGFGVSCCLQKRQASSPPPLRRLFNPALYRRRHAACREKRKRPARVVEKRKRFASESASLPAMAQSATTAHPRRALQKLSRFAFFRKGRSLPLYRATAEESAFVCAALCSPLQKKFARLQEAAVPPGNGSQTQSLPPWQTPFHSSAALR